MILSRESVASAIVALAAIATPVANLSAQQHVFEPFTLEIDGPGIEVSFEGRS